MQLVWEEKFEVFEDQRCNEVFTSDLRISPDKLTCVNAKEEVGKEVISELFQGKESQLKAKVWHDDEDFYVFELKDATGSKVNILRTLRDRFYGNVNISVTMALNMLEMEGDETSTEEMAIDKSRNYGCQGSVKLVGLDDLEEHDGCVPSFGVKMRIAINIISLTDEQLLGCVHVPNGKRVLEKALLCDLEICSKDGGKVQAHGTILAAASSVLEAQFGKKWNQKGSKSIAKLDMSDTSEAGVKAFLRYVYYQDLEEAEKDPEIACELLYVAHKFNLFSLESWAIAYFSEKKDKDFGVDLAYVIYSFVRKIDSAHVAKLKLKTARILDSNTDDLEMLSQYKELLEEDADSAAELCNEIDMVARDGESNGNKRRRRK